MHISGLLREHSKLRSLGADLITLVLNNEPCDLDELALRRWNLARMVHQHLAHEERQLFCRYEADARGSVRTAVALARRGLEQLHSQYASHVQEWTPDQIVARWPEFQIAVKTMVRRMISRVDIEESDLFPLVAHDAPQEVKWQPGMKNWAGAGIAMQPLIRSGPEVQPELDNRVAVPRA